VELQPAARSSSVHNNTREQPTGGGPTAWGLGGGLTTPHHKNKVVTKHKKRIFGPNRDEVTGEWRKLHN
jgi:hypothetical protein